MKRIVMPNDILFPEIARLVSEGKSVCIRVKGRSMLPFIRGDRDDVVLESAGDFGLGDIVLAELSPGAYVLHRVVAMDGQKLTLMGDGNLKGREHCLRSDVKALATEVIKDGRSYDCRSRASRLKARVWGLLLPVRRYLLAIYRRISK